ncbi:putative nuclease HARBI1 [Xyrichtys novacula]|uniref:Nuclease HARBI1 n=1 Tax=Xyrichtys novacula TaxID=13765 RepID=A0AAV1HR65_XYRNO|nr:putative nuclease HARBI1 [Xyrichtys novacula]
MLWSRLLESWPDPQGRLPPLHILFLKIEDSPKVVSWDLKDAHATPTCIKNNKVAVISDGETNVFLFEAIAGRVAVGESFYMRGHTLFGKCPPYKINVGAGTQVFRGGKLKCPEDLAARAEALLHLASPVIRIRQCQEQQGLMTIEGVIVEEKSTITVSLWREAAVEPLTLGEMVRVTQVRASNPDQQEEESQEQAGPSGVFTPPTVPAAVTPPPPLPARVSPLETSEEEDEGKEYVPPQHRSSSSSGSWPSSPSPKRACGHGRGRQASKRPRPAPIHPEAQLERWHTKEEPDVEPPTPRFEPKNPPGPRINTTGGDRRKDFRLTRPSLEHLIHLLQGDHYHGWGKALEVLVFVYWLACGTSYRVVSEAFDVSRWTCHDMVHRVSKDIQQVFQRFIRLPNRAELEEIGAGFQQLAGHPAFCKVAGSIDGCHVRIVPPGQFGADFFNRKLFHSVQFQAIVDHKGHFLDVHIGFPGSVHDSRVLRCSPVYVHQLYPPPGWCLLGDGGYPCISQPLTLITPFREPLRNPTEERFNARHSRARSVVERAFGVLKTRWRSIFLCLFLHNLCLGHRDILEPENGEEVDGDDNCLAAHDLAQQSGDAFRDRMAAAISVLEEQIPALREHDYE